MADSAGRANIPSRIDRFNVPRSKNALAACCRAASGSSWSVSAFATVPFGRSVSSSRSSVGIVSPIVVSGDVASGSHLRNCLIVTSPSIYASVSITTARKGSRTTPSRYHWK